MERPVLARLEVPAHTLLLYEQMVTSDPDRTGNWRFFVRDDGCYFSARNQQLFVTDPANQASDDPAFFWSMAFPDQPDVCFSDEQLAELREAIAAVGFDRLKEHYSSRAFERTSSPPVHRWTAVENGTAHTTVVELDEAPAALKELRATISRLVAAAARR